MGNIDTHGLNVSLLFAPSYDTIDARFNLLIQKQVHLDNTYTITGMPEDVGIV